MTLAAIRRRYQVPAHKGRRVRTTHPTRPSMYATIVGAVTGSLVVETDGPHIRGESSRCHWFPRGLQYLDDHGNVIHDGRHDHLPTGYQFELMANTTED